MSVDGAEEASTSAVDAVDRALEKIAALNPTLNAFVAVFAAEAIAQAQSLDQERRQGRIRGPLHGKPISIKDLIDVVGTPTTAASRSRMGHIARADAFVVARLREAGGVIIGKCNLHELALGTTNEESAFGPARNPHDPSRSPGGSSGGSGAAVAAEMCWASIGTDTGGSIRIPAAACGVVGLKPTLGEIPTTGIVPLSASLDHVGPLARRVTDVWAIHAALTGGPPPPASAPSCSSLRLGKLTGYFLDKLDDDVRERFESALERLQSGGVALGEPAISRTADIGTTYANVVLPEAAAVYDKELDTVPRGFADGIRARLEMGRGVLQTDYVKAQHERTLLRDEVDAALSNCDALVLPTLAIPAPLIGATTVALGSGVEAIRPLMLRLTQLFNLTGHPAISLPCGETKEGLPCGLQLVGRRNQTVELLKVALSCERHVSRRER